MSSPQVTVLVATYGRDGVLCDTLRDLLAHEIDESAELLVIDQTPHHDDATERYLEEVRGKLRYLRLDRAGVTHAENVGVAEARGEIVLFVDDDVRVPAGLVGRHARHYADPDVVGVAGRVHEPHRRDLSRLGPIGKVSRWGKVWGNFHRDDGGGQVDHGRGCNLSLRRSAILACGGIDERYRGPSVRWETDLCLRAARATGGRLVYDPEAVLTHLEHQRGGCRIAVRGETPEFYENELLFAGDHLPPWSAALAPASLCLRYVLLDDAKLALPSPASWPRRWRALRSGMASSRRLRTEKD
jgi:GT2 family glycosyltransferase